MLLSEVGAFLMRIGVEAGRIGNDARIVETDGWDLAWFA